MKTRNQRFRYSAEPVINDIGRRINRLAGDIARIERNAPIADAELEWLAKLLDKQGCLGGLDRDETITELKTLKDEWLDEYNGRLQRDAQHERTCTGTNLGSLIQEARNA